jgi:outer membrane protein assembly factor BamE (lipoprotein component of BamABCDE complex)
MIRITRGLVTALAFAVLAGCAGTNFKRPEPLDLVVGQSSAADVQRVMGPPREIGQRVQNEQDLKVMRYAYAEGVGQGRYQGVVPARAMVFTTYGGVLVAQEFVSSFQSDATEFDETQAGAIVNGKTTRNEVLNLLGRPNGEAVYPVIRSRTDKALVYSYSHAKGTAFNMKFYNKALVISFDGDGVVTDLQYSSTGDK